MTAENQNIKEEIEGEIEVAAEKEPSSFKLISSLGIAGFFSALVLVSVYIYTLPLIEANKAEALRKAIFEVLPACTSFTTLELRNGKLVEVDEDSKKGGGKSDTKEIKKVFAGFTESNELIGFAIPGSEPGFQDIIGIIYGYEAREQLIIGFQVLESKETPGLGDKIFKDADFQTNFTALAVEGEIVPVKKGQKTGAHQVETITGATISSKAIVRLLNKSMNEWRGPIGDYINDNNLSVAEQN